MSPRWLAWALGALTLGLIACAVVLALLNRYSLWDVTFLVAQASAALVDGLIASRRPRNPVGWFIIGHALCFTLGEFSRQYAIYGLLINRTLVYGSLAASLALVYLGSVVALQGLFRALTGQGSQLAVVASTLAIAALFNPLRRRIQAFIDRRFYCRKCDAAKTQESFFSQTARGDGAGYFERGPHRGGARDGAAGPCLTMAASRAREG